MPDTYTKEQIDEAKLWLTTNDTGDSYDQKRRIGFEAIILSALDTAERERDVLLEAAKLDLAEKRIVTEQLIAERNALASRCAELEARLQGAGWISVEERLPEALERVLVFYVNDLGKNRIDIGQHIPPKTVLADDFFDENTVGCSTYDEEHDCYWVNEGWWEDSWQAEVNYKIHDVVTHWMPLPEPPVGKEGEE